MKTKRISMVICLTVILFFTPAAWSLIEAQSLKGGCFGMITKYSPNPSSYIVTIELKGDSGIIVYPTLEEVGFLTFIKSDDSVYWYQEHIIQSSEKKHEAGTIEIVFQKHAINCWRYARNSNAYGNLAGYIYEAATEEPGDDPPSSGGFSRRAEAKNMLSNSVPEGNWVYYLDSNWQLVSDIEGAVYYRLEAYKDGKPGGVVRDYYMSGVLQSSYTVDAKGRKNGIAKWYYKNGQLSCIGYFANDLWNGPYVWYYSSGNPLNMGLFYNGKKIGVWDYFFDETNEPGKYFFKPKGLKKSVCYDDDKKNGMLQLYNKNGKLKEDETYAGDKISGWVNWYYSNGNLKAAVYTDEGRSNKKEWFFWDVNGVPVPVQ